MSDSLDAEEFYDLTLATELAVSPDGDRVAFVADEFDAEDDARRSSLFVVPADGSRPPHRLSRASDASAPRWSPNGSKLAFLAARDADLELKLSDGESDRSDDAANTDDAEATENDDGSANDDAGVDDGDENAAGNDEPEPQVWAFDLELGGDARQLTDFEEGASDFDWGPDGERLVVAARDPTDEQREYLRSRREDDGPVVTERLQHKFDGSGWLDDVKTYLFVVDRESRETERLDAAYADRGSWLLATGLQPRWSPGSSGGVSESEVSSDSSDDGRIAFLSNRTERPDDNYVMDAYTVAPDGSDLRKVTDSTLTASRLRWNPDGDRLAFVGQDAENRYVPKEVFVAADAGAPPSDASDDSDTDSESNSDAERGGEYESWSGEFDRTVAPYGRLGWDGGDVVAPVGDEGLSRLARFREGADPERVFDAQGRDRTVEGFDLRGGTAAVLLAHPGNGKDAYAFDASELDAAKPDAANPDGDAEPRRLTTLNEELVENSTMPDCRRVTFESEGVEIEAIAYLPPEFDPDDPSPRPLVASIHGGPVSYDAPTFSFEYAYWVGQGYVVFRPNYRGSASYGREFSECIRGEWGPRETADALAGVDELVEREWADPDRLYATGFSYGGITTGYLVAETDRFAAAAAEHGVYDFRSAFGTDDSHVWWENDFGLPWENPDGYDAASSIVDAGQMDTPLLVTAGGEDWRCPPSQSEQLYVSLKKRDVPAKLVVYPDEHHAIGDPDRAVHRLEQLADWFESYP